MTEKELRAIEARAEAATPGPWVGYAMVSTERDEARPPSRCCVDSNGPDGALIASGRSYDREGRVYDCTVADGVTLTADAAFIAGARTDIPALVAEVRRLMADRDALAERLRLTATASEIARAHGCRDGETPGEWAARIVAERDALRLALAEASPEHPPAKVLGPWLDLPPLGPPSRWAPPRSRCDMAGRTILLAGTLRGERVWCGFGPDGPPFTPGTEADADAWAKANGWTLSDEVNGG